MPKSATIANKNVPLPVNIKNVQDSLAVDSALKPKKRKAVVDNSPLEWYRLTEITMHVLNAAIVRNVKEKMSEKNKINPDLEKIIELEEKISTTVLITRDPKNFDSTIRMRQLLEEYSNE